MWTDRAARAAALCLFLANAGCAHRFGHDFARPDPAKLVFGVTTVEQVVAMEGAPTERRISTKRNFDAIKPSGFDWAEIGGVYTSLGYNYFTFGLTGTETKGARFNFWNGTLAGYTFASDFAGESTDFDVNARDFLVRPGLDRAQVVAHFGHPDGEAVYPLLAKPGETIVQYEFYTGHGRNRIIKRLRILFDSQSRVRDYKLLSRDAPNE